MLTQCFALIQNGLFDTISKESEAINRVAHFYEFISDNSSVVRNPIWTVPYKDGFNDGMVTRITSLLISGNAFFLMHCFRWIG